MITEPGTQINSLLGKYQSKTHENVRLTRKDTGNLQEESIAEGEMKREELPSFHVFKGIHRMTSLSDFKDDKTLGECLSNHHYTSQDREFTCVDLGRIEQVTQTPVSDLFYKLKSIKDSSRKSLILSKIIDKLYKGIANADRKKLWSEI